MTPEQIRGTRLRLGLTQVQFGQLLGVHSLTVSRWERGTSIVPHAYQIALIKTFDVASREDSAAGETIRPLLRDGKIVKALHFLLNAGT